MTVDLRRFEYPLEALRLLHRWRLDRLAASMGRARLALDDNQRELGRLEERHAAACLEARPAGPGRLDPFLALGRLRALSRLQLELAKARSTVRALRAEWERARDEWAAELQRSDVVERHRADCRAEFAVEEDRRVASDRDRDWLALRAWHSSDPRDERRGPGSDS